MDAVKNIADKVTGKGDTQQPGVTNSANVCTQVLTGSCNLERPLNEIP